MKARAKGDIDMKRTTITTALAMLALAAPLAAKNIDLVTLPNRDTVQLTIYNSEDITLVRETRHVTLKKGANKLQFSWANTLIDPTSVTFRPLDHKNDVELIDTVYPGQKPQHLIWNVQSRFEGQVKVEVSYFTSGLTWKMDYVGITDPDETKMHFRGYVRVFNNSGEKYEKAQVRLIVGTINLVEKIAELARRRGMPVPAPSAAPGGRYGQLRKQSAKLAMDRAAAAEAEGLAAGRKREIVKEGLSEYFMFSVEGTETLPNGWSKRMQAVEARDVPFDIIYRMRDFQYGPRPVRFFIWTNDDEHELGDSPMPDGRVNLYRDNGQDGLTFLGQQVIRYVPIKAKIEINTGPDDLVVYETRRARVRRNNFHFNRHGNVIGWDGTTDWLHVIRNYRGKPIVFELRRQWHGDVEYESEIETTLFDYHTTEVKVTVDARGKKELPATITCHNGSNAKQNRVKLKTADR